MSENNALTMDKNTAIPRGGRGLALMDLSRNVLSLLHAVSSSLSGRERRTREEIFLWANFLKKRSTSHVSGVICGNYRVLQTTDGLRKLTPCSSREREEVVSVYVLCKQACMQKPSLLFFLHRCAQPPGMKFSPNLSSFLWPPPACVRARRSPPTQPKIPSPIL